MNTEYKRLYDAWDKPQLVSATRTFEGPEWDKLIEWCKNNPKVAISSIREQLKEGPTWACQIIETMVGESPVKSKEWYPLDMWCSMWIYIIDGNMEEKKKMGYIPSYYDKDKKYMITKD